MVHLRASIQNSVFSTIKEKRDVLLKIIQKKGIKVTGDYTFLGYNAPFQFWSRRNEVVIPIDWKE